MFGLAAAPEIVTAVPSEMPSRPPYVARVAVAEEEVAGVERRNGEGLGLALLPGQLVAADEVQGDVDDVQRRRGAALPRRS